MTRGKRILLIFSATIAAAALAYWFTRPKEPSYQGKPLSYWIDRRSSSSGIGSLKELDETREAIRQMGTNAVPHLIRMLGGKDSSWNARYRSLIAKLPDRINSNLLFRMARDERAAEALEILGPAAGPAIPALIEKLGDSPPVSFNGGPFAQALIGIGPTAAKPLAEALFNQDTYARLNTYIALTRLDTNAVAAIPDILRFISQPTNGPDRGVMVYLLAKIENSPEAVVPFLINCLDDKTEEVRSAATRSLGDFGSAANAAVPKLIELTKTDVSEVGELAAKSLKQIDPEAAAKAGIK